MTFNFVLTPALAKQLDKLFFKDKILAIAVRKKIVQIISLDEVTIQHFKNLRHGLSDYKRVQIGSFILMFKIEGNTIIFDKFRHHDEAY